MTKINRINQEQIIFFLTDIIRLMIEKGNKKEKNEQLGNFDLVLQCFPFFKNIGLFFNK